MKQAEPEPEKREERPTVTKKIVSTPDFMQKQAEPEKTKEPPPVRKFKDFAPKVEEEAPKPKAKIDIQGEGISAAKANVAALFGGPPQAKAQEERPKIEIQGEGISAAKANVASLFGAAPQQKAAAPAPASAAAAPAQPVEMVLAPDWKATNAPDGRVYYYNTVTKETAWTAPMVPAKVPEPTPAPVAAPQPPKADEPVKVRPAPNKQDFVF